MKNKIIFFSLLCSVASHPLHAQVCQRQITPQSIAASNFDLSGGAEITDKITGRIWKRCVSGQSWNGVTCDGPPKKLSWQEALQEAVIQGPGWRLPDIKELNSILDLQCVAPPLHSDVFPNIPASESSGLWSSTPFIDTDATTKAWWVDLMFGKMDYRSILTVNYALYVKSP